MRATRRKGFALMTATILMGVLLAFSFILLNASLNTRFVGNVFQQALSAEQIAEAGLHKALFCVKQANGTNCGGTYGTSYAGETNVAVGDGRFTTTVTGNSTTKTITSVGTSVTGQTKTVESNLTVLPPTTPMTMAAAVQAGASGLIMANNAEITGDGDATADSDVVSEGDITCGNNATMRGNVSVTRDGGKIHNCKITKSAYADVLTSDTITQDAYYETHPSGISGSSVGGTKYANSATPLPVAFPNIDIPSWKDAADDGGTVTGNTTISGTVNLGPKKYAGNFTTSNNTVITLDGPLWITGNVTFGNNTIVKLNSNFYSASSVIVVDGTTTIDNNADLRGSGTAGSVIVLASTNTGLTDAAPAIFAKNNVTGAVLYAPYGHVHVNNNVAVPAIAALKVTMKQGSSVNASGANIFNSPLGLAETGSTGGWHIETATWREYK